ncbi:hypothetical protein F4X33_02470 [Candidatus Poribacteria bacterium]|nr:hypothetical protein [Candidatus Poribacteria bacterium]
MVDKRYLLSDDAMQDFIINGYVAVKPALPLDFHKSVFQQTLGLIEKGENLGNNLLLSKVPMLQQVFDDPAVHGALISILGQNYVINQHRACHYHPPGSQAQDWHKDYPLGGNVRYHRTRLAMAFYYPQDVTEDMGPTAIQPATQYYMTPSEAAGLSLCGEAGTVTIVHYELWHRATENLSDKIRFMLKFLFCRTEEPQQPSWNAENPNWETNQTAPVEHQMMWQHLWQWYHGKQNGKMDSTAGSVPKDPSKLICTLQDGLNDENEATRLNAAYELGGIGKPAIPTLIEALRQESKVSWNRNLDRGDFTNPSQLDSIYGLAAMGEPAVPTLTEVLGDTDWWTRAGAAAALGCMGEPAHGAAPALIEALKDDSEWVRRNAADTLGNIGPLSRSAVPALIEALGDNSPVSRWSLSDSPLRENAMIALTKMGELSYLTPVLQDALQDENQYIRSWAAIALERSC